jgi:hypothetical protein
MEKNNKTEETIQITVTKEVYEQLYSLDATLFRASGSNGGLKFDRVIKRILVNSGLWAGKYNKHT